MCSSPSLGGHRGSGPTAIAETAPLTDTELSAITTEATTTAMVEPTAEIATTGDSLAVEPTTTPTNITVDNTNTVTTETIENTGLDVTAATITGLPTTHTVVSGDTLGSIALNYYGKSSKWRDIRDANPSTLNGGIKLSLGMELNIPVGTPAFVL